jgi:hypothetical protein
LRKGTVRCRGQITYLEWIPGYEGEPAPIKTLWALWALRNPGLAGVANFSSSADVLPANFVTGQSTHAADASGTWRCIVEFYDGPNFLTSREDTVDVS